MRERKEKYEKEVEDAKKEVEGREEEPREVPQVDNSEFDHLFTQEQVDYVKQHYEDLIKPEESPNILLTAAHYAHSVSAIQVLLIEVSRLIHEFYTDKSNADVLLRTSKVWVIPVVNPDGLEYFR